MEFRSLYVLKFILLQKKKLINFKNWIQIYAPEQVFSLGKDAM